MQHDLIERLEKATGIDHALDREIFWAVAPKEADAAWWRARPDDDISRYMSKDAQKEYASENMIAPQYTGSLDAAMELVPAGKSWGVGSIVFDEIPPRRTFAANCRREGYIGPETPAYDAIGATPALALCVAALKARLTNGE